MAETRKRAAPPFPPPWEQPAKDLKRSLNQDRPRRIHPTDSINAETNVRREQEDFAREQTRLNQIQEAEQMREWVSKEDEFVLQQSKKKARIRVKEGRAKPIDWLAVTLGVIDPTKDLLEDDHDASDIDVVDPAAMFEGLTMPTLEELGKDIEVYMILESNQSNRRYWNVKLFTLILVAPMLTDEDRH